MLLWITYQQYSAKKKERDETTRQAFLFQLGKNKTSTWQIALKNFQVLQIQNIRKS